MELAQGRVSSTRGREKINPSQHSLTPRAIFPQQPPAFHGREEHFRWVKEEARFRSRTGMVVTYSVSTGTSEARHWLAHLIR